MSKTQRNRKSSSKLQTQGGHKMSVLRTTPTIQVNEEALDDVLRYLTPTDEEVADWHFVNVVLKVDRQRPLVQLLCWLVEGPRRSPIVIPDEWIDLSDSRDTTQADVSAAERLLHTAA